MTGGGGGTARPAGRRRRLLVRVLVLALVVVLATAATVVVTLVRNLDREDGVFDGLTDRPAEGAPHALDILLVSTDMVTVLHVDADRRGASMIWLPAGTAPTVAAVERLTGVRIDHYARFDWSVLDELSPTAGPFWPPFEASADPVVDEHRQEDYVRMVIGGNVHQEMRKDPVMLYQFLDTISSHMTVDRGWRTWDLARLVVSMRDVRSWDLRYVTAPTGPEAQEFWAAVRYDRPSELASLAPPSDSPENS